MIFKFFKFIIVGFSGMIVDFSITFLLKENLKVNRYISNSAGFTLAACTNYLFNRFWTFQSNNPKILAEFGTFFIISLIGLGINNLFLWLFERKVRFYYAKFMAIMLTSLWNFSANYFLNFSH